MKTQQFNSISEMLRYIETTPRLAANAGRNASTKTGSFRQDFTKTATMADADRLATGGWPEAVDRMKAAGIDAPTPNGTRTRQTFAPVGYAPSVGRFLSGHPCNMIRNAATPQKGHRIINIYYNICVDAYTEADDMINAGIKLLETVRDIEKSGYRCNIYAAAANAYNGGWQTAIKVKTDGEPLNLSRLSYAIAHPSFFRRHIFAIWERTHRLPAGYGKVARYTAPDGLTIDAAEMISNPARITQQVEEYIKTL